jgi:hypothetical protein
LGLKLGKLIVAEAFLVVVVIVVVLGVIEFMPSLNSPSQNAPIGVYHQREYGRGNATLALGEVARTQFNYTTFDPAILVLDLDFHSWKKPGVLELACNGRVFASVFASSENPRLRLNVITVSGLEWVQPKSIESFVFGNEITFSSVPVVGYEGSFSYEVNIRGSR